MSQSTRAILESLGIVSLNLGQWILFLADELDFLSGSDKPSVSFMMFFNPDSGQMISRVLNHILHDTTVTCETDLRQKCEQFFCGNQPCLGTNPVRTCDSLNFAPDCTRIVPVSKLRPALTDLICANCARVKEDDINDPFVADIKAEREVGSELSDERIIDSDEIIEDVTENLGSSIDLFAPSILKTKCPRLLRSNKRPVISKAHARLIISETETSVKKYRHPRKDSYVIEIDGQTVSINNSPIKSTVPWHCPICKQRASRRQTHLEIHHGIYKMDCHQCPESFMCPLQFSDHTKDVHADNMVVQCKVCKEMIDVSGPRDCFKAHLQAHCGNDRNASLAKVGRNRPFMCDACALSFSTLPVLRKHIKYVHEKKKDLWTCPECMKVLSLAKKSAHLRRMHSYSNFKCPNCSAIGRTGIDFVNHMMLNHPETEEAQCPECHQPFSIASEIISHHSQCLDSRWKQKRKATLDRINSEPHRHVCPICSKGFGVKYLLNSHIRVHKELSYGCSKCSYRTHLEELLHDHMKIHVSKGPMKCCLCEEVFGSLDLLHKHLTLNHTEGTTASCPICRVVFDKIELLRAHLFREHPDGK